MNKIKHNSAFTLVELIVVITILAVLATVAFISFQGYGQSSRDSVRLADIKSAEKVINLYRLTNSRYPTPNDETGITYSGSTAWTQGTFGQNAYTSNTSLSNVPTDPLTGLPYAYSVTNTKQEYQMAAVLEGEVANFNNQSYAGDQIASVYVRGDYNGQFIKVSANSTNYLLGVPSIIASDITSVDMMDIINNQRLVYKGHNNLPASFSGSQYDNNGGFAFTPNQVILFEGDTSDLENDPAQRVIFLDNLQANYGGTVIAAEEDIAEILAVDSNSDSGSNKVATLLNNSLGTKLPIVEVRNSGGSTPAVISGSGTYITKLYGNAYSYAALKTDDTVVTWGDINYGGISPDGLLTDIAGVFPGNRTYAALKNDGTVVVWGDDDFQGDSDGVISGVNDIVHISVIEKYGQKTDSYILHRLDGENILIGDAKELDNYASIAASLTDVNTYYLNGTAAAALKNDGTVVTWGNTTNGGDSSTKSTQLVDVKELHPNVYGFLAVKNDNTGVGWGRYFPGGGTDIITSQLTNIEDVVTNYRNRRFVVKKSDGTALLFQSDSTLIDSWNNVDKIFPDINETYLLSNDGEILYFSSTAPATGTGFIDISYYKSSFGAYAGIKSDGTVVNWGNINYGGDPADLPAGINGVSQIYNSGDAITILKPDGTIAYWGGSRYTGDIPVGLQSELYNVIDIYNTPTHSSSNKKIIVKTSDNRVIAWGSYSLGGDSSTLNLTNVKQVIANPYSTAVLKNDGEIVAWGQETMGGDIPALTYEEMQELRN